MYTLGRLAPAAAQERRTQTAGRILATPRAPGRRGRFAECGRGGAGRVAGREGRGRADDRGGPRSPRSAPFRSLLRSLLQRLLRRGEAGLRKRAAGADSPTGLWSPGGAVFSGSAPADVASGLRQREKGARARAQGLYVNGDSGGGRGESSGAAGRTRSGPGVWSWLSGVDGDDLAAAAADQHHPVQVLCENLEEFHI